MIRPSPSSFIPRNLQPHLRATAKHSISSGGSSSADEFSSEGEQFRSGGLGAKEADAQEVNIPREDCGLSWCVLQRCATV